MRYLLLFFACVVLARAEPLVFQSGPARVALVELFTSEGCSSCPPAEQWLGALRGQPGLWRDFVPLALHVDYWDGLGWKDALASRAFTERQYAHAAHWRDGTVYTPCVVVNGRATREWRSAPTPTVERTAAGLLNAESADGRLWHVHYQTDATAGRWSAHIALLGFGIQRSIRAGENRGRVLAHDFAALSYATASMQEGAGMYGADVRLGEPSVPADHYGVAIWISPLGDPTPAQAVGGYLPGR